MKGVLLYFMYQQISITLCVYMCVSLVDLLSNCNWLFFFMYLFKLWFGFQVFFFQNLLHSVLILDLITYEIAHSSNIIHQFYDLNKFQCSRNKMSSLLFTGRLFCEFINKRMWMLQQYSLITFNIYKRNS